MPPRLVELDAEHSTDPTAKRKGVSDTRWYEGQVARSHVSLVAVDTMLPAALEERDEHRPWVNVTWQALARRVNRLVQSKGRDNPFAPNAIGERGIARVLKVHDLAGAELSVLLAKEVSRDDSRNTARGRDK
jgi:hypothetical protein